ncbi:MAG: class I adenylate-forming enzyme family protein, partial [Chloroflexota bacterium]
MIYGVTPQMIETYGELVFRLSLNIQKRRGDPIRQLDFEQIEAQRANLGLSDSEIADRLGLTTDQARYIRVVMERRRFRRDQYRKLFDLGVGLRYRDETYVTKKEHRFGENAMKLREAMSYDPAQVKTFVEAGWWTNDTLSSLLEQHKASSPDHPAIRLGDTVITYREFHEKVQQLAGTLQSFGIEAGDVVAIQLPNIPEFLISYVAICSLGGVMSTIHMPYQAAEIKNLLQHNRARAVICLSTFKEYPTAQEMLKLKDELETLEQVICLGPPVEGTQNLSDCIDQGDKATIVDAPVGADPFLMLYTSGTSASPKGVPLSYQNMISNALVGVPEHQLTADDIILSAAPFSHLFGLYSFHLALVAGSTNLLLPAFTPPDLAALIDSGKPTALFTAPAHLAAGFGLGVFKDRDFSSLTLTIMSGSACPPDLFGTFKAIAPNCNMSQLWGMTELQAGLYTRPDDPLDIAAHYAGRPSPGTEARLVSATGEMLGAGEEGELEVRGCSVFPGYFDNDAANADAFSDDGWFRSGDLAVMDEAGNIKLVGRVKDIINRGGVKFNPLD